MNDYEMYIIQGRGILTLGCFAFVVMNGHLEVHRLSLDLTELTLDQCL